MLRKRKHDDVDSDSGNDIMGVVFTTAAYKQIKATLGTLPAMKGCILLGHEDERYEGKLVVRDIIFDKDAISDENSYTIDVQYLNPIVRKKFYEEGLNVVGMAVSHPRGRYHKSLSYSEQEYYLMMKNYTNREILILPIIFSTNDGKGFKLYVYVIKGSSSNFLSVGFSIVDEEKL